MSRVWTLPWDKLAEKVTSPVFVLDVASFVPLVGDAIDVVRGVDSAVDGRWGDAVVFGLGVFPIPGIAGGSTKAARAGVASGTCCGT